MPRLVLVNGLPGSGKSTVARALAAQRPLTLVLDVDVVRGLLAGWITAPATSGSVARELALAMCATHLAAGHDVIVPQFLGRPGFAVALERVANDAGVPFVEIALVLAPERAAQRLAQRAARAERPEHADAAALLEREGGPAALAGMQTALRTLLDDRPSTHLVDGDRGLGDVLLAVRSVVELHPPVG